MLANEQVIDGRCERCGTPVEARQLEQWFFRITDYADRLLDDLDDRRLARARRRDAAQLDRALRGRRGHVHLRGARHRLPRLHDPSRHAVRRDLLRDGARAPGPAPPGGGDGARGSRCATTSTRSSARTARSAARPIARRRACRSGAPSSIPSTASSIPMWVSDYVLMEYGTGAIMAVPGHDPRDHAFATRFGLEIRRVIDGGERAPLHGRRRARQLGPALRRDAEPRGARGDRRLAGGRGPRPPLDQLPPARLAALAPALLGLPDPGRALRRLRPGARARRPAAGAAARRHRLQAEGQVAARHRRGLGQHHLPEVRQAGAAGDGHDGHVRRLLVVLPALLRRGQRRGAVGPRGARALGAGRPVHRRRRARDPAPDVRALLRQGARRHGPPGRTRSRSRRSSRRG